MLEKLSAREKTVASLIACGLCNKLIARQLGLTESTVKVHLRNIYNKLSLRNRTQLATTWIAAAREAVS